LTFGRAAGATDFGSNELVMEWLYGISVIQPATELAKTTASINLIIAVARMGDLTRNF